MALLPLIAIFALMYLLLVRPQQRKARAQREMIQSLSVGREVQTIGGIVGHIVYLDDQYAHLEVAPGVTMTFARAAISRVLDDVAGIDLTEEESAVYDGAADAPGLDETSHPGTALPHPEDAAGMDPPAEGGETLR